METRLPMPKAAKPLKVPRFIKDVTLSPPPTEIKKFGKTAFTINGTFCVAVLTKEEDGTFKHQVWGVPGHGEFFVPLATWIQPDREPDVEVWGDTIAFSWWMMWRKIHQKFHMEKFNRLYAEQEKKKEGSFDFDPEGEN